ncbi:MAG: hypothetical protein GF317_12620 [Candidatus Lokiarchaeota archaeon]|nr:hypothetical protein [Candidatus Lokiarchaeota archaeon]MBD3200491.1 hypothetical protein [Candidatus Lokiarchaeota archaeon]
MQLKLTPMRNSVFIGDKLPVRTNFSFDEDTELLWSGIRLLTSPPCQKDLQISQKEVFSRGIFEAGEYIREKALLIKNNVVPTIEKRDLAYRLQLYLRKPNPVNADDNIVVQKNQEILIKPKESSLKKKPNPISLTISGLHIELKKDVFKPGETIKINYTSENLREIEIRLLQKANLVCFCESYGRNCQKVEELPPAIAGDVKTKSNTEQGYLLLKVPEVAEPSHNYLWEPSEKEHWGLKYGDYCEYSLLVIGRKKSDSGREPIKFDLPITVQAKPIVEEELEADLFAEGSSGAPSLFEGVSSKFQKIFQVISIEALAKKELESRYKVTIKNTSKDTLDGITVKLSGLQEGLFETAPKLTGFNKWDSQEEKEIFYESKQKISAIVSIIEDNKQKNIRLQGPIN